MKFRSLQIALKAAKISGGFTLKEIFMPEKCENCEHDRFRQEGDDFLCKKCGHRHYGEKASDGTKISSYMIHEKVVSEYKDLKPSKKDKK